MAPQPTPVADSVVQFITNERTRSYPVHVINAARMCLADWTGVAVGAATEAPGMLLRAALYEPGDALLMSGGTASSATAALINGTLAHSLDFDDTHVASLTHLSGPTWAAVLALAPRKGENADLIGAFVTGFEVGGRLGSVVGPALLERGVHATGTIGALAAAAAGCALLGLNETQTANALGLAATQAGGLTASFGTMAKPFHAGKAAMNAVIAVLLARNGFTASLETLDHPKGLAGTLIQDGSVSLQPILANDWQILKNTFKPYASCLLTHPSIDCARQIASSIHGGSVEKVTATVHPLAIQLAGKPQPQTPLEGKFSLAFCIALSLCGYKASAIDFSNERVQDPTIRQLVSRVELKADPALRETAAQMSVTFHNGDRREAEVEFALGNPENPMQWPDMQAKFISLAEPHLGSDAEPLFAHLRTIDRMSGTAAFARFRIAAGSAAKSAE